jgi:hypothetical protein
MKTLVLISVMYKKIHDTTKLFSGGILVINIFLILLSLNVLSSNFGFILASSQHLIALFILLGVVLLNLPLRLTLHHLFQANPHRLRLLIGSLLCIFGFLLLISPTIPFLWISSIPVILSGLTLSLQEIDRKRNELPLLAIVSFGYSLIFLLIQTVPSFWVMYQQTSLLATQILGGLTHTSFSLGPTASGLGILLVSFVYLLGCFIVRSRKTWKDIRWFILWIFCLGITWFFYLLSLSFIIYPMIDALNYHFWFFLLCLIPCFGILLRYQNTDTPLVICLQKTTLKHQVKNIAVWAAVLLFLSVSLLTVFIPGNSASVAQQKIVFYGQHMVGTWDIPAYGAYGKDAVGMFGLWPIYLTTFGYTTEILVDNTTHFLSMTQDTIPNVTRYLNLTDYTTVRETPTLTTATLADASVFIVSNLNVSFSEQEQTVIWDFVQKGGSLLVIGDHTNVGDMEGPLNDLLTPVGIRYRFDAALPFDEKFKWLTCTEPLHHPINFQLTDLDTLQYGVGASLDLSSSAYPILIGSSVLSDAGNQSNRDLAYLGDYDYNRGEQLGDVILIAGAYYGEGKVIVFGDTSMFQNPAVPFSYRFLQGLFTWLTGTQTGNTTLMQLSASLVLLICTVLLYSFFRRSTISFAWLPLLLCLALLLTISLNPLFFTFSESGSATIVAIDASHGERFSIESFTDDSLNGLLLNLERNNLQPRLFTDFSKNEIQKSKLIVFNAPTAAFTSEEIIFLQSYMEQGGIVLLATGYEDKDASLPLLKMLQMDIDATPLGPVPYVEENETLYQNEPRFVDSWPVEFPENQTTSYYNFTWGDSTFHLVVFRQYGAGGLLLIGDSQYLLDKNLESIYDYWPGNILFLKYLLEELPLQEEHH